MDTFKPFDLEEIKDMIFLHPKQKLDDFIEKNKEEMRSMPDTTEEEQALRERQRIFWVLLDLSLYFVKYTDVDLFQFEEVRILMMTLVVLKV